MLRVSLKRSYYLSSVLVLAHLAAAATLIPVELAPEAKFALVLAVAVSLVHAFRRYAFLLSRHSIVAIELKDRESAAAQLKSGVWCAARVLGSSYVSPLLTVLNLRIDGCRLARHALIVPDNVTADDFRRLRVILRWAYVKSKAAPYDA